MVQAQGTFDKLTRNPGNAYPTFNHWGTRGNQGEGPIRRTPRNRMGTEHTGFGRHYLEKWHACSIARDGPVGLKDWPGRQGERRTGDLDHTSVLGHQGEQRFSFWLLPDSHTGSTSKRRRRVVQIVGVRQDASAQQFSVEGLRKQGAHEWRVSRLTGCGKFMADFPPRFMFMRTIAQQAKQAHAGKIGEEQSGFPSLAAHHAMMARSVQAVVARNRSYVPSGPKMGTAWVFYDTQNALVVAQVVDESRDSVELVGLLDPESVQT